MSFHFRKTIDLEPPIPLRKRIWEDVKLTATLAIGLGLALVGAGCASSGDIYDSDADYYSETESSYEYERERPEPENPYSEGSGHYAGYEWAEETGNDCGGNSDSFIEGCEEYYSQLGE